MKFERISLIAEYKITRDGDDDQAWVNWTFTKDEESKNTDWQWKEGETSLDIEEVKLIGKIVEELSKT